MRRPVRYAGGRALAVLLCLAGVAQAQYPPMAGTRESRPGFLLLSISNRYLRVDMRRPAVVPFTGTNGGYGNFRGGRVFINTVEGDPFVATADNGVSLTNLAPYSTWSSIRLADADDLALANAEDYEVETTYAEVNDPREDPFLVSPIQDGAALRYTWQIREGLEDTTQVLSNAAVQGTPNGLTGSANEPVLLVAQLYELVRDMVRVEVQVTNVSTSARLVGAQTFVDASFGGASLDGTKLYVDTAKDGVTSEFMFPSVNPNVEPGLRTLPSFWRAFDDQDQPGVILGGRWHGGDIDSGPLTAGPPSLAAYVAADLAGSVPFTYTPVNVDLVGENWGILVRWNPVLLSPNSSRRYITYFGLGGADSDFEQPYALSVEAPFSLGLQFGDDPSTTTTEGPENVFRAPNPFTLRAQINNISTRPLTNLSVSVALPDGFRFAQANETISKTISTVAPGTESELTWDVQSLSDQNPGVRTITVSASGSGLPSKVIERQIGIPALPQLRFPNITHRLDMISVPYDFTNRDIQHIMGSLGNIGVTGGGNAAVARYSPGSREYRFFPDAFITSILPGEAVWLFNGSLADLVLPEDRARVPETQRVSVPLTPDWNQVGCPYTVPTRLFDTEVVTTDNVNLTFDAAVSRGLIRPVLYEYSPDPTDPGKPGAYLFSGDEETLFNPWRGYWIRALDEVTLVYSATSLVGPFRGRGRDALKLNGGWELSVDAATEGLRSGVVRVGEDAGASDTYDRRDVDQPPPIRGRDFLRLSVDHPDWGRDSGAYLRDIRALTSQPVRWRMRADCDVPNEIVTLRWNLREVPADVQLTLVDLETGARRHLRTTSGYSYNTGPFGGSRLLELVATRGGGQRLGIAHMQVTPQRGRAVAVTFTLSAPATAEVVIESPTGRRVRTLARGYEGEAGQNAIQWDGQDDAGRPVPAGQYRCRVLVHTPDGQRAIAERIILLKR